MSLAPLRYWCSGTDSRVTAVRESAAGVLRLAFRGSRSVGTFTARYFGVYGANIVITCMQVVGSMAALSESANVLDMRV